MAEDQCVRIFLKLSDEEFGEEDEREAIFRIEDRLEQATVAASAGEFDGNEFGGGWCTLYFYGRSADALFAALMPVLTVLELPSGSHLIRRYGPPGSPETTDRIA